MPMPKRGTVRGIDSHVPSGDRCKLAPDWAAKATQAVAACTAQPSIHGTALGRGIRTLRVLNLPEKVDEPTLKRLLTDFFTAEAAKYEKRERPVLLDAAYNGNEKDRKRAWSVLTLLGSMRSAVTSVRIVASPTKNGSSYALVDFVSPQAAALGLEISGPGAVLPDVPVQLRLCWSTTVDCPPTIDDFQLYLCNLPPDITDNDLLQWVQGIVPEIRTAMVAKDGGTLNPRALGFGFLRLAPSSTSSEIVKAAHKIEGQTVRGFRVSCRPVVKPPPRRFDEPDDRACTCLFVANLSPDVIDVRSLLAWRKGRRLKHVHY
eukprot:GHVT01100580.1.p1 GENE.GHVT01100580.1~~GHVT01100580.1.p1  ORF type:complete len:318 (+),score=17.23 GHVT01100580.1:308-1261(+)